MKIHVNFEDHGFFTQTPITVQKIDKEEGVVWCNHDGAESDEDTIHHAFNDGTDMEYTIHFMKCDKCEAWQRDEDDYWNDAPFEGVTQ